MFSTLPTTAEHAPMPTPSAQDHQDTIETRLWLEEHVWLYKLLRSENNVSPTFRFPDLIAACVSLVFTHDDAPVRIFRFLGTRLVLRDPSDTTTAENPCGASNMSSCSKCSALPANRHPNPKFQLDQLTTACVALCRDQDESGTSILLQARRNMAERAQRGEPVQLA